MKTIINRVVQKTYYVITGDFIEFLCDEKIENKVFMKEDYFGRKEPHVCRHIDEARFYPTKERAKYALKDIEKSLLKSKYKDHYENLRIRKVQIV